MPRCRRCQIEILWARLATPKGTAIPLDYRQVDDGDMFVIVGGDVAIAVPEVERFAARRNGQRLYAPHRRLCPERRSA